MRLLLLFALLMGLTGCLSYDYGTAVPYDRKTEPKHTVTVPANAPPIAQQFRPPAEPGAAGHMGLDVATAKGTPVLAAASGVVTQSFSEPAYGNRIIIEHGKDSAGRRVQTLYFHLDTRLVNEGQRVARGQQIGTLGETGLLSSYPHLHFEYHRETAPGARVKSGKNWWQGIEQRDPNAYWVNGPGRVTCYTGQRAPADKITYPVACR